MGGAANNDSAGADLVVWCLTDAKAGHLNQLRGLTRALGEIRPVRSVTIEVHPTRSMLLEWARRRFRLGQQHPDPALILAAGHQTHLAALAAQRARGGRLVVLMKPSLPCRWFDLCLVPAHDAPRPAPNVILTRGVLNNVRHVPPERHQKGQGLILVGGPSAHHGWDGAATAGLVAQIVRRDSARQWRLTTSRRTPPDWLAALPPIENLEVIPVSQTPAGWVGAQMAAAAMVWVTEDSVSMIYEALTAGAAVGVLPVPRRDQGRVSRGLDQLLAERWLTSHEAWAAGEPLRQPPERLDEASRCARLVNERLFGGTTGPSEAR